MAALSVSTLPAQSQPDQPYIQNYCYGDQVCPPPRPAAAPVAQTKPVAQTNTVPIPSVIHFCAAHCLTFTLEKDGTLVNTTNLPGQTNERRVFTIKKFTPESVIIHRKDTGSNPGEADLTGSMFYGNSSAGGQGWQISWGAELDKLAGTDPPVSANAQQSPNPLALLLGLLLSSGDGGGSGGSGGDIAQRISSLERQLDSARENCNTESVRRQYSSCDRAHSLESQISQAHGELIAEIQKLTEAHNQLAAECGKGNKEACDNQRKVDERLAGDRQ